MIGVQKQQERINYLGRFQQRTSLRVVIEKIGKASAIVRGDLSKEALRELLMSELSLASRTKFSEKEVTKTRNNSQEDIDQDVAKDENGILNDNEEIPENIDQFTDLSKNGKEKKQEKCDEQISKNSELDGKTLETKLTSDEKSGNEKNKKNIDERKSESHSTKFSAIKGSQEFLNELLSQEVSTSEIKDTFLSEDIKWLNKYFKQPLISAMKEIIARKPSDPVNYLGFWLLNYRNTEENRERKSHFENESQNGKKKQNQIENITENISESILEKG